MPKLRHVQLTINHQRKSLSSQSLEAPCLHDGSEVNFAIQVVGDGRH